tara:strand:+ start:211 stop:1134 length:924 start_codon:yes stop_codon:yes gene_type:complete
MKISSVLIKEKVKQLGFQKVGIARARECPEDQRNLNLWLEEGRNGTMEWIKTRKEERGNLFNYFPEAKSVISVGLNYYVGTKQKDLNADYKFSNYAWGDDYHNVLKEKLFELLNWINAKSTEVKGLVCVDTAPIMEKVWAREAGLGWIGKHTNLITTDYGSWIFLGELLLDIELDYDPIFNEDLCGKCTACIDSCPTDAIGSYKIDAKKCISYLTIEHRGDFNNSNNNLDGWIYGCDICQEVCPWNNKFAETTELENFQPRSEIINYNNNDWNDLTHEEYNEIFKKSSVKRTKYKGLKRNININKVE